MEELMGKIFAEAIRFRDDWKRGQTRTSYFDFCCDSELETHLIKACQFTLDKLEPLAEYQLTLTQAILNRRFRRETEEQSYLGDALFYLPFVMVGKWTLHETSSNSISTSHLKVITDIARNYLQGSGVGGHFLTMLPCSGTQCSKGLPLNGVAFTKSSDLISVDSMDEESCVNPAIEQLVKRQPVCSAYGCDAFSVTELAMLDELELKDGREVKISASDEDGELRFHVDHLDELSVKPHERMFLFKLNNNQEKSDSFAYALLRFGKTGSAQISYAISGSKLKEIGLDRQKIISTIKQWLFSSAEELDSFS